MVPTSVHGAIVWIVFQPKATTKEIDMELYAGIDLHSNNSVVSILDEHDRTVFAKRLPNDLAAIIAALRSCSGNLNCVAVESTYNW